MKQITPRKDNLKYDDENVKYKLNTVYVNSAKSKSKKSKKQDDDDGVRYKLAPITPKSKAIDKRKSKPKIKVNFWSNKHLVQSKNATNKKDSKQRHTICTTDHSDKQKVPVVKVRKRVSFLPSPVFTDDHVPMVTVPDDLTIQLNSANAKAMEDGLNLIYVNETDINNLHEQNRKKSKTSTTQTSPRTSKGCNSVQTNWGNENELEFFSKYVVQKLRRMETNQRIYAENLINTVLMFGQLRKLNGKSKILEA
ncbi:uncharacterized protein LOC123709076 [Pieris brassicae]|uniref:uncharacterized protein LOC123709076 n=1 Tax=Pieris brassicae TaxID=7116 RepID=UPI001E6623F1|nr:uncharacterized protein LOC123709076 [Pieris brassicae]